MTKQHIHTQVGNLLEAISAFENEPGEAEDQARALTFVARALALLVAAQTATEK
jgi:hypothetical protein